MKWNSFRHGTAVYELDHLDPFDWEFESQHGETGNLERYKFHVLFSHHVFTSKPQPSSADPSMPYGSPYNDGRVFDIERYHFSRELPKYIRSLDQRSCLHTSHNNFLRIEFVDDQQGRQEYEIYFRISKANDHRGWLRMMIESAYVRDENRRQSRPKTRNIRLQVIARNVLRGKPIKKPK